jgi:hypothetical protein
MKLAFYNHYGNGDLFESREFVLDWMRLAGVTRADYAHRTLPGLFADLPQLNSVPVIPEMDMRRGITRPGPDELWVNTWIGRDSQYVVNPGIGCVVEQLYRMHNDLLLEAYLSPLPRSITEYIPSIDYARLKVGYLRMWIDQQRGKRLVLLCNGPTGSGQAANFYFGPMFATTDRSYGGLDHVIPVRENVRYIFTQLEPQRHELLERGDVFFTDDLTGREPDGWDLNEISYLSRSCDVIVGRCSGAQMFAQVLPNWMDSRKTLLCFTHHRNGACFVLNPEALCLRMKVLWSPADNAKDAAIVLENVLRTL